MTKLKTIQGQELEIIGYCVNGSDMNTYRTKPNKEDLFCVIVREKDGSRGAVVAMHVANFDDLPKKVKP